MHSTTTSARNATDSGEKDERLLGQSLILEKLAEGVNFTDASGVIRFTNPAFDRMFGYARGELNGRPVSILNAMADAENAAMVAGIAAQLGCGESWHGEIRNRRKDGSCFLSSAHISPLVVSGAVCSVCVQVDITQERRAREELVSAEAFLKSIIENIPDMIFVKDADTLKFVRFNRAGGELLGYPAESLIGKNDYDFFPREEADFFTSKDRQVLQDGKMVDIPHEPIQTRHRGIRTLHTKKIPILDDQGRPKYLLGISEDITDREEVRKALLDSEARYKELYENIPIMYFTLDAHGVVQSVNAFGARHLGYAEDELVGRPVLAVFHPEDQAEVMVHLQDCLAHRGGVANWQFRKVCKDGSIIWVQEAVRVVADAQGKTVVLVACEDITERKEAERQLSDQTRILKSVLDNMGDGVVVADEHGRFLVFNPAAEKLMGLGRSDATPPEWPEHYGVLDPVTRERLNFQDLPLTKALNGKATDDQILLIQNPNVPQGKLISVNGRPLRNEHGELSGGIAVFHDITARKQFEEECQRLATRLLDAQEEERQKVSAMLHDHLGQMLTLARMELATAEESAAAEKKNITSAMRRIDEALASVRRIALSLRPPLLDDLGLDTAMETLVEEFSDSSKIQATFQRLGQPQRLGKAMETCLYRVLQEGLTNIAKHARASLVRVTWQSCEALAQLDIHDNGTGFDATGRTVGKGIGLLGMRERLNRLGGKLEIHSQPGQGTLIQAVLPASQGERTDD